MTNLDGYAFIGGSWRDPIIMDKGKRYEVKWSGSGKVERVYCIAALNGTVITLENEETHERYADYTSSLEYAKELS